MPEWYVYLVRVRDGALYTGIATDVPRRFAQHQKGDRRGSKYLRGRGPLQLVLQEPVGTRGMALRVELRIKKLPKNRKEQLVCRRGALRKIVSDLDHEDGSSDA